MIATLVLLALLQAPPPADRRRPAPSAVPAAPGDYEVGPGDVIEVAVYGNDDLSRIPTVQTNGSISLPLLGEVQVAGLTIAEVQRKITNLLEKDYLVKPQVEVKVRDYNSQYVSVVGEVNSPGRKPIRGRMRLIDVLIEAGGFKPTASGEVMITRTDGDVRGRAEVDHRPHLELRLAVAAGPGQPRAAAQERRHHHRPPQVLRHRGRRGEPGRAATRSRPTSP